MTGTNVNRLAAVGLALFCLAMAAGAVLPGGLYLTKYEGDTLHLMQILARMEMGQVPHVEFSTPIGALSFWPMVWLINGADLGFGAAFVWSQILLAGPLAAALVYAARRLAFWPGLLAVGAALVLALALVHGEPDKAVAVSMHYNRWAWAILYLVVLIALFEGGEKTVDGVLIGLGMGALAMIKVTYFVAFAPAIIAALLTRKAGLSLVIALITGAAVALIVTLIYGFSYWPAYIRDLIIVAESTVRDAPGDSFGEVVSAPKYIAGSFLGLAAVVILRTSGASREGLVVLLLLPAFFYVTYQNFGNDPQWLPLLAVICLAVPQTRGLSAVVLAVLVLAVPSFLNMGLSPLRHGFSDKDTFVALVPNQGNRSDIWTEGSRGGVIQTSRPLSVPPLFDPSADESYTETEFMGETLPDCTVGIGLPNWFGTIAGDIEAAGFGGQKIFVADLLSAYWLYGGIEPPIGGAPWYYGGLPGMRDAELLMVPHCALLPRARAVAVEFINDAGTDRLSEVHRTELYVLYAIAPEAGSGAVEQGQN